MTWILRLWRVVVTLAVVVLVAGAGVRATSTAATKPLGDVSLIATLSGRGLVGGDLQGRGTVWLELRTSTAEGCFSMRTQNVPKGLLFIAPDRNGTAGRPVLVLLTPKRPTSKLARLRQIGNQFCLQHLSTRLISTIASHPRRFFVALLPAGARRVAIRGRLVRRPPGLRAAGGLVSCTLQLYDDSGLDFAGGGLYTPNGTGHLVEMTVSSGPTTYLCSIDVKTGTITGVWAVHVYIENPLYSSNTYYCDVQGIARCLGPRSGSVLSGYSLKVIYYLCAPGAWPGHSNYCVTTGSSSQVKRTVRRTSSRRLGDTAAARVGR